MFLYRGSSTGLKAWRVLTEADFGAPAHDGDGFGYTLAAGDVDGDHRAELFVGAPDYPVSNKPRAGAVFAYLGSTTGPIARAEITQDMTPHSVPEAGDGFGAAIALGRFGGGNVQIAIGVPNETVSGVQRGYVNIFDWHGGVPAGAYGFDDSAFPTVAYDSFGTKLAVGDLDGDGKDDLVVLGNSYAYLFRASASQLAGLQRIAPPQQGWTTNVVVGAFHGRNWPNGSKQLEIGLSQTRGPDPHHHIYLFKPIAAGSSIALQSEGSLTEPGDVVLTDDDLFGAQLLAADFDGDGYDEIIASAPEQNAEDTTPVIVTKGWVGVWHGGDTLSFWNDRIMKDEQHDSEFGSAVAVGNFDGGAPALLDMAIGAPHATAGGVSESGLSFIYKGDGTIPNYVTTFDQTTAHE